MPGRDGGTIAAARHIIAGALDHHVPTHNITPVAEASIPELLQNSLAAGPVDVRVITSSWSHFAALGLADALGLGHNMLVLHERPDAACGSQLEELEALSSAGAQLRLLARRLPDIAILGDMSAILVNRRHLRRSQTSLVQSASLVSAMRQFHSVLWEEAVSLDLLRTAATHLIPDPVQAQVLTKLSVGIKDETAARQLNISVRTYRRHVAGILKALDVTSRFEAGLKVAKLDLLSMTELPQPCPC